MVFDDIPDSSMIACPGYHDAKTAVAHNISDFYISQLQEEAFAPIAHSTMLPDPEPGTALGDHPSTLIEPDVQRFVGGPPVSWEGDPKSRGLEVGPVAYAYVVRDIWPNVNPDFIGSHELLDIYTLVRATCLPNYLSFRIRIPSNIVCDAWDHLLAGYHDYEITDFLRFGWPSGYMAPAPPVSSSVNHPSATNFPDSISKFLDKEVALGAMLGPFPSPPF